MPLFTLTYTAPTDVDDEGNVVWTESNKEELSAFLLELKNIVNNLDDLNFPSGGEEIDLSKIANGSLITSHASRHSVGGADPLKASSVCGSMIQMRSINGGHIQPGCIQLEHLGFSDSIADLFYFDPAPLTALDGETIDLPSGYTEFRPIILGYSLESGAGDAGMNLAIVQLTPGVDSYTVSCYATAEDAGAQVPGEVYYIRIAW
jgi:hypothetical protein